MVLPIHPDPSTCSDAMVSVRVAFTRQLAGLDSLWVSCGTRGDLLELVLRVGTEDVSSVRRKHGQTRAAEGEMTLVT